MIARRFNWEDNTTVYRQVEEALCEPLGKGRYSFVAYSTGGQKFAGSAFETTVGDMCSFTHWQIQKLPSRKDPTKMFNAVGYAKIEEKSESPVRIKK